MRNSEAQIRTTLLMGLYDCIESAQSTCGSFKPCPRDEKLWDTSLLHRLYEAKNQYVNLFHGSKLEKGEECTHTLHPSAKKLVLVMARILIYQC